MDRGRILVWTRGGEMSHRYILKRKDGDRKYVQVHGLLVSEGVMQFA
jgi:hypothetical protein